MPSCSAPLFSVDGTETYAQQTDTNHLDHVVEPLRRMPSTAIDESDHFCQVELNVTLIHEAFVEVAVELTSQAELFAYFGVIVVRRQASCDLIEPTVAIVFHVVLVGGRLDQL